MVEEAKTSAPSAIRRALRVSILFALAVGGFTFVASAADVEQPSAASSDPASAGPVVESAPEEPPVESVVSPWPERSEWASRVGLVLEGIAQGASSSAAADELYEELAPEILNEHRDVLEALRQRSPDALERREQANLMYDARLRLLERVSPSLRTDLVGTGQIGMRELRMEFEHAKLDFLFQTLAIPRGMRDIADGFRESPLDEIWRSVSASRSM